MIGVGQVLVGQVGHSADEGLGISGHLQSVLAGFDLPPAGPDVAQPKFVQLFSQDLKLKVVG